MLIEIKDALNNADVSLNHITKVYEDKTDMYADFKSFLVIELSGSNSLTLKGWDMEKWREFKKQYIK